MANGSGFLLKSLVPNLTKRVISFLNHVVDGNGNGYVADFVTFDGTNDYIERGADLSGNADGQLGILSAWLKSNGDGTTQWIYIDGVAGYIKLEKDSSNKIIIRLANSSNSTIMNLKSTTAYTTSSGLIHVLAAWDLANQIAYLYIDDVDDESIGDSIAVNDTIDYTRTNHYIGGSPVGNRFDGCISEFYFNMAEFLDISVEANRRKFINAAGDPVDLGSDGSTPTSTAPIVYQNGDFTNFETNQGTGGNFTVTGALTTCSP
jgi:hypothetical protein